MLNPTRHIGKLRSNRPNMTIKIIIAILLLLIAVFGIRSITNSVYEKEIKKSNTKLIEYKNSFLEIIKKSDKSSQTLTNLGMKLLKNNQTEWAAIVLENAANKDPNYRDAAVYTGYAFLRLAQETDELKNTGTKEQRNTETEKQYNNKAIEFLEKAIKIDPLFPRTYELLTIAYKNTGDDEKSVICYNKLKDLSKK